MGKKYKVGDTIIIREIKGTVVGVDYNSISKHDVIYFKDQSGSIRVYTESHREEPFLSNQLVDFRDWHKGFIYKREDDLFAYRVNDDNEVINCFTNEGTALTLEWFKKQDFFLVGRYNSREDLNCRAVEAEDLLRRIRKNQMLAPELRYAIINHFQKYGVE